MPVPSKPQMAPASAFAAQPAPPMGAAVLKGTTNVPASTGAGSGECEQDEGEHGSGAHMAPQSGQQSYVDGS